MALNSYSCMRRSFFDGGSLHGVGDFLARRWKFPELIFGDKKGGLQSPDLEERPRIPTGDHGHGSSGRFYGSAHFPVLSFHCSLLSCSLITTVTFMECFLPGAGLCSLPAFLPVIVTRNPWHHPKGSDLCSPKHSLPAPVLNTCMSSLTATPEGLEG